MESFLQHPRDRVLWVLHSEFVYGRAQSTRRGPDRPDYNRPEPGSVLTLWPQLYRRAGDSHYPVGRGAPVRVKVQSLWLPPNLPAGVVCVRVLSD